MRGFGVVSPALSPASLYDRIALYCGILAVIIGSTAFIGWAANARILAGVRVDYIPMAPNTSLLVILLGCALCLISLFPMHLYSRRAAYVISWFGIFLAGITLLGIMGLVDIQIDYLFFHPSDMLGSVPVGRMSPVTAGCFLLLCFGFLLQKIRPGYTALIAAAVSGVCGVMIIGYWYDAPLLYGGSVIPVAFPTTVALIILGTGLIALCGPGTWPLSQVSGESTRARLLRSLLPVTVLLVLFLNWVTIHISGKSDSLIVLISALWVIISAGIVYIVVSRLSRTIGGALDKAESDRKRSEEQLRESQNLLIMAQEISHSGCWVYNPKSGMVWQSAEASRIYGFPPVAKEYVLAELRSCIAINQEDLAIENFLEDIT
ncbi:MAG TPA: hypothetical protein VN429_07945, partial [Methanospirillum sp.]|uniref:hypothetical protein n=1 Tax=Methanospirillum sp. TaxID=45200 RepID=UPI002CD690BA